MILGESRCCQLLNTWILLKQGIFNFTTRKRLSAPCYCSSVRVRSILGRAAPAVICLPRPCHSICILLGVVCRTGSGVVLFLICRCLLCTGFHTWDRVRL